MIRPRELSDRNEYEAEKESEKDFMFRENIRLASERETLKQYQEVLEQEKQQLMMEMKEWNRKFELEKNRLRDEQKLFERKLQILQNAYHQLELDRKAVENEK